VRRKVCTFNACTGVFYSKGLCEQHYQQNRRGSLGVDRRKVPRERQRQSRQCSVGLCNEVVWSKEVCQKHYGIATRYLMTPERITEFFEDAQCASCGATEFLHVDHDHRCCPTAATCGKCVRGLLCRGCNQALGHLQESPERMLALAAYISGFTSPV